MSRPSKYRDELRERGVRLVFESGRPIAHVARDLGVHRETLRLWVCQAEADSGTRNERLTTAERESEGGRDPGGVGATIVTRLPHELAAPG